MADVGIARRDRAAPMPRAAACPARVIVIIGVHIQAVLVVAAAHLGIAVERGRRVGIVSLARIGKAFNAVAAS